MVHHTAYKLDHEQLDVVIVEDSKSMQTVLRTILMPLRLFRTRVYDSADEALHAMLTEPPNLVITDWRMRPTSGYQLLKAMRQRQLEPLCFVPVIFVTAHATRPLIEKAIKAGAHHVLAKPLSPARLHECIHWITRDGREFVADETGTTGIAGVVEAFDAQHKRLNMLSRARALHQHLERRAGELQTEIDSILAKPEAHQSAPVEETSNDPVRASLALMSKKFKQHEFAEIRKKDQNEKRQSETAETEKAFL